MISRNQHRKRNTEIEVKNILTIINEIKQEYDDERFRNVLIALDELTLEYKQKRRVSKALDELMREKQLNQEMVLACEYLKRHYAYKEKRYEYLSKEYKKQYELQRTEQLSDFIEDMVYHIEEKEDEAKWKLYKAKSTRRLKAVATLMAVIMLFTSAGYAWYLHSAKHAATESMNIMTPYTLYLLDGSAEDYLELSVGDLHPGETKKIVVCVSSHDVNQTQISKNGEFPYSLELVHTNNLKLNYKLYPLTVKTEEDYLNAQDKSSYVTYQKEAGMENYYFLQAESPLTIDNQTGEYSSDNINQSMYINDSGINQENYINIVNLGIYEKYSENFTLSLNDTAKQYNYFLVEISWPETMDFAEYVKETDLIYLIARAGLPKPIETTTAEN